MFERLKNFIYQKQFSGLVGFGDFTHSYLWQRRNSLSLYEKSLYVSKAIGKRAEKVGQIDFILHDKRGDEIENEWTELLRRPNPHQSGDQFWRLAQKYYDIVGACYILKKSEGIFNKKPTSLELLRADLVEVVLNKEKNDILGFTYHHEGKKNDYTPDEIIYLYNPDPRNPLLGESLIVSAIRTIETETQISEYHANVIKNGGKPEMIIGVEGVRSQEELDRITESYVSNKAEKISKGVPYFAGGKLSILSAGMSPAELGFLDTKISTLNDIVIATGVPKSILGVTSDETFANSDASIRIFLRETIKPLLNNITDALNWQLIPDEFTLEFIDPTPEDMEDKRKNIETASKVNSLTTNEKREMLGLDPAKDGDDILVPFNVVPLKGLMEEPKEKKIKSYHPLQNRTIRKMYAKQKDAQMTKFEERMLKATNKFFNEQKERLLDRLGETRKRKDILDGVYSNTLEISLAKEGLVPVIRQIFIENGKDTAQTFGLDFNMSSSAERSIIERANLFTESIINTTSDQLARNFRESFEAGENREQLVRRIESLYGDISKGRAEVIARTEVHAAMQNSNLEVYRQAGLSIKIWVHVDPTDTSGSSRATHQEIDGEEAPLDGYFSNGLFAPSEPNCRCQI